MSGLVDQCCCCSSAVVLQCLCILQMQGRVNVLCMTGDRHVSRAEGAAGTPTGAADTRLMRAVILVCLSVLAIKHKKITVCWRINNCYDTHGSTQHQAINWLGLGSYSYI